MFVADVFLFYYNCAFGEQCTTMDNILVAHYDLEKEYIERMYEASGHNLMVFEDFAEISIGESPHHFLRFLSLSSYMQIFRNHCIIPHNAPH